MSFTHVLRVRFRDCDALGHVNNAVYLTYFEEARTAWFLANVRGPEGKRDFPFILASAEVSYKSPARFGEDLAIAVRVAEVRQRSFALGYRIESAGRLVAEGKTVQVAYDYAVGMVIAIPSELQGALTQQMDD